MTALVAFDVVGTPKPQGSKSAYTAGNGKARVKESGGLAFAAWRNAVADQAKQLADQLAEPLDGALYLHVTFRFKMTGSARKADRERGWRWKVTAPDTSKLVRCVEDGIQAAGLVADDARFAELVAEKHEVTGWTGASITIGRVEGAGR